ncbi:MAG TPA: flavin reductase family protein [Pyrodictium sp.]|nr:flavin reductase family protein [Pyrodictium sp.]
MVYTRVAQENLYKLFHPRPVYIVAAGTPEKHSFMAIAWLSPLSEDPPRIMAAFGKESFTYQLIKEHGVFSVNILDVKEYEFIFKAGTVSGKDVDKEKLLGAKLVYTDTGAPRLEKPEPIAWVEAKVFKILDDVAEDVDLVIADILAAYAKPKLFNERYGWVLKEARIPLHVSGRVFTTISGFYMARG